MREAAFLRLTDQYLIWLASRDPAAVLRATDRPNSGANPPIDWRMHRESNVDRQKVEMVAVQAIKGGHIKARIEFNGEWFTPDDPEWISLTARPYAWSSPRPAKT